MIISNDWENDAVWRKLTNTIWDYKDNTNSSDWREEKVGCLYSIIFALHTVGMGGNRDWQDNRQGKIIRVCDVNRHQGSREGRNFLITPTELRWTGQKAGKTQAILTNGCNASCHPRAGPTRRNLKELVISCVTGQFCMQWQKIWFHIMLRSPWP